MSRKESTELGGDGTLRSRETGPLQAQSVVGGQRGPRSPSALHKVTQRSQFVKMHGSHRGKRGKSRSTGCTSDSSPGSTTKQGPELWFLRVHMGDIHSLFRFMVRTQDEVCTMLWVVSS